MFFVFLFFCIQRRCANSPHQGKRHCKRHMYVICWCGVSILSPVNISNVVERFREDTHARTHTPTHNIPTTHFDVLTLLYHADVRNSQWRVAHVEGVSLATTAARQVKSLVLAVWQGCSEATAAAAVRVAMRLQQPTTTAQHNNLPTNTTQP